MGITNGYKLFTGKGAAAIRRATWKDLEGEELFDDLSILIYKYSLVKLDSIEVYQLLPDNPTRNDVDAACIKIIGDRISKLLHNRFERFKSAGVKISVVIDGPPHKLKEATSKLRRELIQKKKDEVELVANEVFETDQETIVVDSDTLQELIDEGIVIEEEPTPLIEPISIYIEKVCDTPQHYLGRWAHEVAKEKIRELNINSVQAPNDAEGYASYLTTIPYNKCHNKTREHAEMFHDNVDGEIWCSDCSFPTPFGVITEDTDVMAFGGKHIIRTGKGKNVDEIDIYDIGKLRQILKVSQYQLVQACIIMGCDFFPGVKGLGPVKAIEAVKKCKDPIVTVSNECGKEVTGPLSQVVPKYWEIVNLFMHK